MGRESSPVALVDLAKSSLDQLMPTIVDGSYYAAENVSMRALRLGGEKTQRHKGTKPQRKAAINNL
ncbi:MAG: hypothetical protein DMG13_24930 [Acidobacteria bacterium]|nr:MAG: hypothetical protein DMG13_24930 [Acidobacteriota bacterium]